MSLINKAIDEIMDRKWNKKSYRVLDPQIGDIFQKNGFGIYVAHTIGNNNDLTGRMIQKITGPYSHSMLIWYTPEGILNHIESDEMDRLCEKYRTYYKGIDPVPAMNDTKALVLGSADSNGMNYFNFSQYQNRKMITHKLPFGHLKSMNLVHWMLKPKQMDKPYDYTGLAFWWLFRMFDDDRAWYCSEQVKDVCLKFGYDVCPGEDNPSPTQNAEEAIKVEKLLINNV